MAFAASDGTLFGLDMAGLALFMIGHHESWLASLRLESMTVGTSLILGALALDQFSIFVNMMAHRTIFQSSLFVVVIMIKCADRTFQFSKGVDLQVGVVLRKSRNTAKRDAEHHRAENKVSV